MRKFAFFLLGMVLAAAPCYAVINEMGSGMVFGDKHAFTITAPERWVLDNQTGVPHGIHMLFYPAGRSWQDSMAFAYGDAELKTDKIKTVEDQVTKVINHFHATGNPDYAGTRQPSIFLPNGKEVILYFFEGDKWGNYEAAAYFEEAATINYLVFNARTKRMFDIHYPAFKKMVLSYQNTYVDKNQTLDDEKFEKLFAKAKRCVETPAGGKYEQQIVEFLGDDIANYINGCIAHIPPEQIKDFDVICKIEPDGAISEIHIRPSYALSVCFRGALAPRKLPAHNLGEYYFLLEIDLREGPLPQP